MLPFTRTAAAFAVALMLAPLGAHAQGVTMPVSSTVVAQLLPDPNLAGAKRTRIYQRVCNITPNGGATVWILEQPSVAVNGGLPLPPLDTNGHPSCQEYGVAFSLVPQHPLYAIASGGNALVTIDDFYLDTN